MMKVKDLEGVKFYSNWNKIQEYYKIGKVDIKKNKCVLYIRGRNNNYVLNSSSYSIQIILDSFYVTKD